MSDPILAPIDGDILPLEKVSDPVFAQGIVGKGFAITPAKDGKEKTVIAPIGGTIVKLHPHAFVIRQAAEEKGKELAILVHLGLDTVKLSGEGFTLAVAEGDEVAAGDEIVRWRLEPAEEAGYDTVCPVILFAVPEGANYQVSEQGPITAGEVLAHDESKAEE